MTGTPTYRPEEIEFVLHSLVRKVKHTRIREEFEQRFNKSLAANQIRYIKNKYGRDSRFNVMVNFKGKHALDLEESLEQDSSQESNRNASSSRLVNEDMPQESTSSSQNPSFLPPPENGRDFSAPFATYASLFGNPQATPLTPRQVAAEIGRSSAPPPMLESATSIPNAAAYGYNYGYGYGYGIGPVFYLPIMLQNGMTPAQGVSAYPDPTDPDQIRGPGCYPPETSGAEEEPEPCQEACCKLPVYQGQAGIYGDLRGAPFYNADGQELPDQAAGGPMMYSPSDNVYYCQGSQPIYGLTMAPIPHVALPGAGNEQQAGYDQLTPQFPPGNLLGSQPPASEPFTGMVIQNPAFATYQAGPGQTDMYQQAMSQESMMNPGVHGASTDNTDNDMHGADMYQSSMMQSNMHQANVYQGHTAQQDFSAAHMGPPESL